VGDDDTDALHAVDTERAGRELCRPSAVKVLTEEGPERVRELVALGVPFDPELSLEGGHSRRRVSSVEGAATGWAVTSLLARLAARTDGIATREATNALALWVDGGRCLGVLTPDGPIAARATILATGGAAALWARSTNPEGQIGDGIAIAYAAGAAVADLEFMQFHPTVLAGSRLLLTEALRGEGATLLDANGERFVDELAPRDEVARAIVRKGRAWLDLRAIDRSRFPGLMIEIEKVFETEKPDALVILGDTNSALCTIIAKRRKIAIFHMEAGNRCFDFNVPEEVNRRIVENHPVRPFVTTREYAAEIGALAFFEEKYGEFVRVLEIDEFSRELCGGTHVSSTSQIGLCKITASTSVGANTRRLEAITSAAAIEHYRGLEAREAALAAELGVPADRLAGTVRRRLAEIDQLRQAAGAAASGERHGRVDELLAGALAVSGATLVAGQVDAQKPDELLALADEIRATRPDAAVILLAAISRFSDEPVCPRRRERNHRA